MASSLHLLYLLLSPFILFPGQAQNQISSPNPNPNPNPLVVPVSKHPATLQYLTHSRIGASPDPIALLLDRSTAAGGLRRFSLCLSSSDGFLVLGHGRKFTPITNSLTYTPLVEAPQQQGYVVRVNHIKIGGRRVSLGGPIKAKISTTAPFTKMESRVFATFVEAFAMAMGGAEVRRVAAVEPFEVCYGRRGGGVAPEIELVLQSEMVKWRVEGMVRASEDVMCLGIVDGGPHMEVPMVIGGHQLEDVWLQFDLGTSMLGFSSIGNTCSSFRSQMDCNLIL